MKLGYLAGTGYYVAWYCPLQDKVVYTWFPNLAAAEAFFSTR